MFFFTGFKGAACKYCKVHYRNLNDLMIGELRILDESHALNGVDSVCLLVYAPDTFHDVNEGIIEKIFKNLDLRNVNEIKDFKERVEYVGKLANIDLSSINITKSKYGKIKISG